jgi:hypothetical protein
LIICGVGYLLNDRWFILQPAFSSSILLALKISLLQLTSAKGHRGCMELFFCSYWKLHCDVTHLNKEMKEKTLSLGSLKIKLGIFRLILNWFSKYFSSNFDWKQEKVYKNNKNKLRKRPKIKRKMVERWYKYYKKCCDKKLNKSY